MKPSISKIIVKIKHIYHTIHCEFSGNLKENGETLLNYYNSDKLAQSLITQTFLDSNEKYNIEHSLFNARQYGTEVRYQMNAKKPTIKQSGYDYLYIFEDGKWYVESYYFGFQELNKILIDSDDSDTEHD